MSYLEALGREAERIAEKGSPIANWVVFYSQLNPIEKMVVDRYLYCVNLGASRIAIATWFGGFGVGAVMTSLVWWSISV